MAVRVGWLDRLTILNILSSTDLRLLIRALSLSKGGEGGMVRQAHHIKHSLVDRLTATYQSPELVEGR